MGYTELNQKTRLFRPGFYVNKQKMETKTKIIKRTLTGSNLVFMFDFCKE